MKTHKPPRSEPTAKSYDVGYGKPPIATRFQPGQSGNSNGRPRKNASTSAVLEHALRRKVRIVENGLEQRLENIEVLFRSLVNRAIKRDNRATMLLMQLIERWQVAPPKETVTEIRRVIVEEK